MVSAVIAVPTSHVQYRALRAGLADAAPSACLRGCSRAAALCIGLQYWSLQAAGASASCVGFMFRAEPVVVPPSNVGLALPLLFADENALAGDSLAGLIVCSWLKIASGAKLRAFL